MNKNQTARNSTEKLRTNAESIKTISRIFIIEWLIVVSFIRTCGSNGRVQLERHPKAKGDKIQTVSKLLVASARMKGATSASSLFSKLDLISRQKSNVPIQLTSSPFDRVTANLSYTTTLSKRKHTTRVKTIQNVFERAKARKTSADNQFALWETCLHTPCLYRLFKH